MGFPLFFRYGLHGVSTGSDVTQPRLTGPLACQEVPQVGWGWPDVKTPPGNRTRGPMAVRGDDDVATTGWRNASYPGNYQGVKWGPYRNVDRRREKGQRRGTGTGRIWGIGQRARTLVVNQADDYYKSHTLLMATTTPMIWLMKMMVIMVKGRNKGTFNSQR